MRCTKTEHRPYVGRPRPRYEMHCTKTEHRPYVGRPGPRYEMRCTKTEHRPYVGRPGPRYEMRCTKTEHRPYVGRPRPRYEMRCTKTEHRPYVGRPGPQGRRISRRPGRTPRPIASRGRPPPSQSAALRPRPRYEMRCTKTEHRPYVGRPGPRYEMRCTKTESPSVRRAAWAARPPNLAAPRQNAAAHCLARSTASVTIRGLATQAALRNALHEDRVTVRT